MGITQAAFARELGISRQAIQKAVRYGRLTLIDGKVDPVKGCRELLNSLTDIKSPFFGSTVRQNIQRHWPEVFDGDSKDRLGPPADSEGAPGGRQDELARFTSWLINRLAHFTARQLRADTGLDPETIWRIAYAQTWAIWGLLGEYVNDPDIAISIPDVMNDLDDPKNRAQLILAVKRLGSDPSGRKLKKSMGW
jgi:hypothetical protein